MFADHRFVRAAAARLGDAADATGVALAEGHIGSARVFTDRLLRRAAQEIDRFRNRDQRWRAKAFVDDDGGADPAAEVLGLLEVDLPDYSLSTGFLAAALLIDPERPPAHEELAGLRATCSTLLQRTPAAYVFVYRPDGVIVVPAAAVVGSVGRPDRLHRRRWSRFYEEHFSCFIGDGRLASEGERTLEELVRRYGARTGLALHVEHASTPRQESLFRR